MSTARKWLSRLVPGLLGLVFVLGAVGCALPFATATAADTLRVTRVIDGDTIVISTGQHVRYIGMDTPEMSPTPEPFAKAATEANRQLVEGKSVRLEKDISETDRYGRLLRYVWVDGTMVNQELVRRGLARAKAYPPDTRYQLLLEAAEAEARLGGRGIWAASSPAP
jgi:micrococcal nuclease